MPPPGLGPRNPLGRATGEGASPSKAAWPLPPGRWQPSPGSVLGRELRRRPMGASCSSPWTLDPGPCPSSSDSTEPGPAVLFPLRTGAAGGRAPPHLLRPLSLGAPQEEVQATEPLGGPRWDAPAGASTPVLRPQWPHVAQTLGVSPRMLLGGSAGPAGGRLPASPLGWSRPHPAPVAAAPAGETLAQAGPRLPGLRELASGSLMSSHKTPALPPPHIPPVPVSVWGTGAVLADGQPCCPQSASTCREGPGAGVRVGASVL